jgi:membrane-bound serine protease (ClpP class)
MAPASKPGVVITALTLLLVALPAAAQDSTVAQPDTIATEPSLDFVFHVEIDGAIQPASAEFLIDAIAQSEDERANALIIELDTPGGLVDSTRDIIQAMLASRVPVVVYVSPGGARAGSAGVFITLAAHVAAMAPGTNIGAATPINIGGGDIAPGGPAPADSVAEEQLEGQTDLERKILNDTVAFIRTIAEKRGRNAEWAERAVREADAITETEALELNVIDLIVPNLAKLLDEIDGREVEVLDRTVTLVTAQAEIREIPKGLRFRILDAIANPNIAFILMLIGIYGIFFELMNPGAILPGVAGVISLLLAFFALQALPVNYVGVLLLLFSLVLFIAEVKIVSYGLLTVSGIIAFVLGAVVVTAGFFVIALGLAYRTWRTQPTTGREGLIGERGVVRREIDPSGQVLVHGELWKARADEPLESGTEVEVTAVDGLTIHVKRT